MTQPVVHSPNDLEEVNFAPLVLVLAALTFVFHALLVWLKPLTISSVDLDNFAIQAQDLLRGINPYISTNTINYPPLWLQWLYAVAKLSEFSGVPLQKVILFSLVGVESVLVWQLGGLLLDLGASLHTTGKMLIFGVLLNPVMISQVCIHGHFDVLVSLWIALAVRFLLRAQREQEVENSGDEKRSCPVSWLFASLFIGLGILTKTVPALLLPFLIIGAPTRYLALGAYLALMPALLGLSIIYVLAPEAVTTNVFGYRSIPGYFGWTGLVALLHKPWALTIYTALSSLATVFFMALLAVRLGTGKANMGPRRLVSLVTITMMFPILWGSGFGPQYIMWFYPLLLVVIGVATKAQARRLAVAAGMIALHYGWEYSGSGVFPGEGALGVFSTAANSSSEVLMHAIWLARMPVFVVMAWVWVELVLGEVETQG